METLKKLCRYIFLNLGTIFFVGGLLFYFFFLDPKLRHASYFEPPLTSFQMFIEAGILAFPWFSFSPYIPFTFLPGGGHPPDSITPIVIFVLEIIVYIVAGAHITSAIKRNKLFFLLLFIVWLPLAMHGIDEFQKGYTHAKLFSEKISPIKTPLAINGKTGFFRYFANFPEGAHYQIDHGPVIVDIRSGERVLLVYNKLSSSEKGDPQKKNYRDVDVLNKIRPDPLPTLRSNEELDYNGLVPIAGEKIYYFYVLGNSGGRIGYTENISLFWKSGEYVISVFPRIDDEEYTKGKGLYPYGLGTNTFIKIKDVSIYFDQMEDVATEYLKQYPPVP